MSAGDVISVLGGVLRAVADIARTAGRGDLAQRVEAILADYPELAARGRAVAEEAAERLPGGPGHDG